MQGTNDETFLILQTGTQEIGHYCQNMKVKMCTESQHELEEAGQVTR
jgi:hypothetical protein